MSNSSALLTATATSSANRSARRSGRDLGGRPVLTVRGPLSAQVPWRADFECCVGGADCGAGVLGHVAG